MAELRCSQCENRLTPAPGLKTGAFRAVSDKELLEETAELIGWTRLPNGSWRCKHHG
jgi:hypothetical protein